jgi:hypothetical protein
VYYVVDADRATPGQLELARSPAVRKAVQRAGMGWRLLRSDQAQLGELGLTPIVEREGLPVLVLVDERGIVLQVMRSPMESDVVGAIGHATTRALH